MKGFQWSGDLNGHKNPIVNKVIVPLSTAIEDGEPIQFTQGAGVAALENTKFFTNKFYGVSINERTLNNTSKELEVSISLSATYSYRGNKDYTLTGGSTTTAVLSTLQPQVDDFYKNGSIKIVSCAASPGVNGRIVRISSSTGATGTLTLKETLPATLASGDIIHICLGDYATNHVGFQLTSDGMDVDFESKNGQIIKYLSSSPYTMDMEFTFQVEDVVLEGELPVNPVNLAPDSVAGVDVTVTGAELGDFAIASFVEDDGISQANQQYIVLTPQVLVEDTVRVLFKNEGPVDVDLDVGKLYVKVLKKKV